MPIIGMRVKLYSKGSGRWEKSGGEAAKFGLTTTELLEVINRLKEADRIGMLRLLHFHIGSQLLRLKTDSPQSSSAPGKVVEIVAHQKHDVILGADRFTSSFLLFNPGSSRINRVSSFTAGNPSFFRFLRGSLFNFWFTIRHIKDAYAARVCIIQKLKRSGNRRRLSAIDPFSPSIGIAFLLIDEHRFVSTVVENGLVDINDDCTAHPDAMIPQVAIKQHPSKREGLITKRALLAG